MYVPRPQAAECSSWIDAVVPRGSARRRHGAVNSRQHAHVSETPLFTAALRRVLPLQIDEVQFNDPMLVMIGESWSLALVGAWEWRRDGNAVTSWGEPDAGDQVWDLCGLAVTDVLFRDATAAGDCAFSLSDGTAINTHSDHSGYETWTLTHNDLDFVLVATD